ncbi:MAG: response regulator [Lachnospiraceae bacterium]|nr:response regulator [Lachnospiraceae bacterium]
MKTKEQIISSGKIANYDEFLSENRKAINRQFAVAMRFLVIVGPLIAIMVKLHLFMGVTFSAAVYITVYVFVLTIIHTILLHRHEDSFLTSLMVLLALEGLLLVVNGAHLTIYITWFLIPLMALQFCDFKMYFVAAIINYGFMTFATWQNAAYFTERRIDFASPFAYFAGRLGGLTVEMIVMLFAGYSLCRIMSIHYRTLIEQFRTIREHEAQMKEQMDTISAIANIYMTVYELDAASQTFKEITAHSKPVTDIVGNTRVNPQEIINSVMAHVTDEDHLDEVLKFVNLSTLNDRLRDIDTIAIEYRNKQKLWRRGRFIVSGRDENRQVTHLLWLAEDIDQEKRERDRLIDTSERAIAASEAKSSFLSNMSHEIRTPINAVLGMNEMILRECDDRNILGYSESIKAAGSTLLGLVNDILDFSKIEAGKMEIIPVDYDLSSVINDLVNMIRTKADDKGLKLELEINREVPKFLYGDEVRIKQVITNILTNAVKYTEKGMVTLCVAYEKISEEPDSIMLNVAVKDTGIGIKQEDMKKLFSEFDRIEEERNRNVEGTGLGMSITKRLLEMMGSSLRVESTYGLGSIFSFSLKQAVVKWEALGDYETAYKEALVRRDKYREKFRAPGAEVLVVDDTPMNLEVFKNLLKQTGIKIETAVSGDEALSLAFDKKYDIIFLDHMMPGKDGIQTLHELQARENDPNLDTPVICLTANAISGAREKYLAEGFDNYLSKPIDSVKLENMLIDYLPGEKILRSGSDTDTDTDGTGNDTQIPDCITGISEIDTQAGIKHCGSIEGYLDTVRTYAKAVKDYADETEKYWRSGDIRNATIKIHALKSSSRIIGAMDLGELAQELENAGKENDTEKFGERIDELLERYRKIGEALSPLISINEPDESELKPINEDELGQMYTAIREFISVNDYDSVIDLIETLKGYRVPDNEKDRRNALIKAADEIEYEEIKEIMEEGGR